MFETFVEKGFIRPEKPMFLPDEEYSRALSTFVFACADTIVISDERPKKLVLAKRKNEPMAGHWWTFGGRMQFGEAFTEAAARIFKKETRIIWPSRWKIVGTYNFMCSTRTQEPKDAGSHSIVILHAILLQPGIIDLMRLDPKEYSGEIMKITTREASKKIERGELHSYFRYVIKDLRKMKMI